MILHYLKIDPGPWRSDWTKNIEDATPLMSVEDATAWKKRVPQATAVIEKDGYWYVVRE